MNAGWLAAIAVAAVVALACLRAITTPHGTHHAPTRPAPTTAAPPVMLSAPRIPPYMFRTSQFGAYEEVGQITARLMAQAAVARMLAASQPGPWMDSTGTFSAIAAGER